MKGLRAGAPWLEELGRDVSYGIRTRMALGASRRRITGLLLVEGLLVAFAGGALGLAAAPVVSRVLLFFLPEDADLKAQMDYRVFLFALATSAVAGAVCGLATALQARRCSLAASIAARSTAATSAVRVRKAIVIAQLAFTLVLLVGAGLFVQTLMRLHARDRGFHSARLLMFRVDPAGIGYSETEAPQVIRELLRTLRDEPGIERVAVANNSLLSSVGPSRVLTIESDRRIVVERPVPMMRVSAGFFGGAARRPASPRGSPSWCS